MNIREKTLEELEELEMHLRGQDESKDGYYSQLISVYQEMYNRLNKLKKKDPAEYEFQFRYIEKKLVAHYITYGTYMKMGLEKNPHLAKSALQQALRYDSNNPVAHYRLGFLAYQKRKYFEALQKFQAAIKNQESYQYKDFSLNEMQLYYAQLYSINSALYVAEQSQQNLQKMDTHPKQLSYESSPLLHLIETNEEQLHNHAFYHVTREGKKTCSIDDCNNLLEKEWQVPPLILYFADRTTICSYAGKENDLSFDRADILRHLLLACTKENPGTRHILRNYFDVLGEVVNNTFIKKIGRLKSDLEKIHIADVIRQTTVNNETAFYVEESLPFIVLYRVDDIVAIEMGLNE